MFITRLRRARDITVHQPGERYLLTLRLQRLSHQQGQRPTQRPAQQVIRAVSLLLTNPLGIGLRHRVQGGVLPLRVEQHATLHCIDAAPPVQFTGQRLVVEHRAKTGMQAEQRRHSVDSAVKRQQWVWRLRHQLNAAQLSNAGLLHQIAQLEAEPKLRLATHPRNHLEHVQRITAQLEEVIVDAHLLQPQDVLPDADQRLL